MKKQSIAPTTATPPVLPSAIQHGVLSRHLILPWEDVGEYAAALDNLRQEYQPQTPTEAYLVEELAGIIWRKRRLRIAEAAHYHKEINNSYGENITASAALACVITKSNPRKFNYQKALACNAQENAEGLEEIASYRNPAMRARDMLEEDATYEEALATLADITREWWEEALRGEGIERWESYTAEAASLAKFLDKHVLPYYHQQHEDVLYRPQVKRQAEGEAYMPSKKMETFNRYEVHLDRKFERTLTVLLRLQEMRVNRDAAPAEGETA